jgi:hypothetical protein
VDVNLIATECSTAAELMGTVPASDLATPGSEQVSLSNPEPDGGTSNPISFKVAAAPAATTWVRAVAGVTVGWDMVWDSVHSSLYISTAAQDPKYPDMLVPIDPVSGAAGSAAPAGSDPEYLSLSSDGSYLWASLFGSNTVQRYVAPGLAKDISIPVPTGLSGSLQEAGNIQAAPVSPHTLAMVAGDSVYIYDDATARPTSLPGLASGGPDTGLLQWGNDDSTLYSIQNLAEEGDGIFPLQVSSSGVRWNKTGGGLPVGLSYYNRQNGLTYAFDGTGVYDTTGDTLIGQFDVPEPDTACTADATLNRYYCLTVYSNSGVDVYQSELWVFNLSTYALIDRVYFGTLQGESGANQPNASISGSPRKLLRWGNAGLALLTTSGAEYGLPSSAWTYGAGGVFLIDGAAVNPNAAPDVATGTATASYAQLSSLSPQSATAGSGDVSVTINGSNFSPDSAACWNCSFLQERLLPTTYVNSTQLNVLIPASQLATAQPLAISILDQSTNLFSTNGLTFSVLPTPGSTKVTPLNLAGLSMAWDETSQLLYVGTADYDGSYPNSIVAVNGQNGTVMKSQAVFPDPDILSDGAGGQFLYAAFADSTSMTQYALPSLTATATWRVQDPKYGYLYLAGDLKAAPVSPHTTAVTLFNYGGDPRAVGGVAIFDDGVERPTGVPRGPAADFTAIFDTLAWSSTDEILAAAQGSYDGGTSENGGPLYELAVSPAGVSFVAEGSTTFTNYGQEIHSDFGNGLIYSDSGEVVNPSTTAMVGSYAASGMVTPDSSLNRVFILGQTSAQANTNNYTIQSFDENTFGLVSSISLENLAGSPIQMVRWGTSGLAVLTTGGVSGVLEDSLGMLYLIQDSTFVSNSQTPIASSAKSSVSPQVLEPELVQQWWKRLSKRQILNAVHNRLISQGSQ